MRWDPKALGLVAVAAGCLAACDQIALGPPKASSAPPEASTAPVLPDFRAEAGRTYSDFVAGPGAAYAPDALGLEAGDRARLWRAMAVARPAELVEGGGATALVFRGCAEGGCEAGAGVVAIDLVTGSAFVGVRDVGGADELTQNDRIEALLRLNSPDRRWDDEPPPP